MAMSVAGTQLGAMKNTLSGNPRAESTMKRMPELDALRAFAAFVVIFAKIMLWVMLSLAPVFIVLFLAPVFVPLHLLTGWIHGVASVNPATAFLGAGRDLISGQASDIGVAVAIALGLIAAFGLWSLRSLRSAEAVGG